MMQTQEVDALVAHLNADVGLLKQVRRNPHQALRHLDMPNALNRAVRANRSSDLRAMPGRSDDSGVDALAYTQGPKCSTGCTQMGCYTDVANCPSKYACTGVRPKC